MRAERQGTGSSVPVLETAVVRLGISDLKFCWMILRHCLGVLLLSISPGLLTAAFERILEDQSVDQLTMVIEVGCFTTSVFIAAAVISVVIVAIAHPWDKRAAIKAGRNVEPLCSNIWMVLKVFSIPVAVVLAYSTSKLLLLWTSGIPVEWVIGAGALAAILGFLLSRPLLTRLVGVSVELLRMAWASRGEISNYELVDRKKDLTVQHESEKAPKQYDAITPE